MTSHPSSEVFRPIDDPIYQLSSQPLAVDKDTVHRTASYVNAQTNGSATLLNPLNSTSGTKTTFTVNNPSGSKLRWGTMGLAVEMVFHQLATAATATAVATAAAVPTIAVTNVISPQPANAPSWNMIASLINSATLKISGVEVYKSTNFLAEFTARLLRHYDYDALNHRDEMLFTPVGSMNYCIGSAADATAVPADATHVLNIYPEALPHMSASYFNAVQTAGPIAPVTFAGLNPSTNPLAADALLRERARRWCSGNTHQRTITKIVSFLDLFPRISDCVMRNLRQFEIEIEWARTTDLLEHTAVVGTIGADGANAAARTATHGAVSATRCFIITDAYAMAPTQAQEVVSEKVDGQNDQFMILSTRTSSNVYASGSDIVLPSIRHFDSLMIMQPARDYRTAATADETARIYQSTGEFLLFGNSNGTAKLTADEPAAAGTAEPISSVQLSYSGVDYPSSPIEIGRTTNGAVAADFARLYQEYIKGIARIGRRDVAAAVPYAMFKSTMPFVYLRPFSDDAVKQSAEGKDLTVRIRGGSALTAPANTINLVVFYMRAFSISPDGVCREIS